MLPVNDLRNAIRRAKLIPFEDYLYRKQFIEIALPPNRFEKLLYDESSLFQDGRYSPAGLFRSIYFGESEKVAERELMNSSIAMIRSAAGLKERYYSQITIYVNTRLRSILDLGNDNIMTKLGLEKSELMSTWVGIKFVTGKLPTTQLLGSEVFKNGNIEAIRFPSTKSPGGYCMLVFTERLKKGSWLKTSRSDGLPGEEIHGSL